MKKYLTILAALIIGVGTAFAISPTYKGYGDLYTGYAVPSGENYGGGSIWGFSTTHGVQLIDGVFVGLGIDGTLAFYEDGNDTDYTGLFAAFAEGRYSFLRTSRISPFAGLRIGGGANGYVEEPCFYFSPSVGCTFNITKRFGFDVSIGYSFYSGVKDEDRYDNIYTDANVNCICFRAGIHF